MTTIQPGTRCGCRDGLHSHPLSHHKAPFICTRDAVRMVTVPLSKSDVDTARQQYAMAPGRDARKVVPLCEPCAAYHEAKAAK
jgi:hypothetical protein